jgi:hypothetical protein
MGNRFQAYVSVLLLAMLSNYVFLMDEQAHGTFEMAEFFEGAIDWAVNADIKTLLHAHCAEVMVDTASGKRPGQTLKKAIGEGRMEDVWPTVSPIQSKKCASVQLEGFFNGDTGFMPGTYFLVAQLGGLGGDAAPNPHYVTAMQQRSNVKDPAKMSWCAVGCLSGIHHCYTVCALINHCCLSGIHHCYTVCALINHCCLSGIHHCYTACALINHCYTVCMCTD